MQRLRREGSGGTTVERAQNLFGVMKKALEMDCGTGCTTLRMYLIPLTGTKKMVKIVNFILYIFYHNKNHLSNTKVI